MRRILSSRQAGRDRDAPPRGGARDGEHREPHGHEVRRSRDAASGVGALGSARLDAGHDGYHSQPRYERRGRRGRRQAHGQSPFRVGLLSPLRADVRRRGVRHEARIEGGSRSVRGVDRRAEEKARREDGYRPYDRRSEGVGCGVPQGREGADGIGVPRESVGSVVGRDLRRVRFVDERARYSLSQTQQHSRRVGYRSVGAGHGVRQHGRELGHGRGILARRRHG